MMVFVAARMRKHDEITGAVSLADFQPVTDALIAHDREQLRGGMGGLDD